MRFASKLSALAVVTLLCGAVMGQQKTNPNTGINWPQATGQGAPTAPCTSTNYLQPYQNTAVTPNTYYTCGTDGWVIRTGGPGPAGPTGPPGQASSVGPQGTVQVAGSVAGSLNASTTNNVNAAIGYSNGSYLVGDSLAYDFNTTSTGPGNFPFQNSFGYLLQAQIGGVYINRSKPGDTAAAGNWRWVYRDINPQGGGTDPIFLSEHGTNDAIKGLGVVNYQNTFSRIEMGMLALAAVPAPNKILTATLAGGFAVDSAPIQPGMGVVGTTNGAVATYTLSAPHASDTLYACYKITDSNGGTFTLSLDGNPQTDPFNGTTTWFAQPDGGVTINVAGGAPSAVVCARFPNQAVGTHHIAFTITSATSGTNVVTPEWIGAAPAASTLNPYAVAISPNYQNAPSAGAPYATTYASIVNSVVTQLAADGLNVLYADTANAILNAANCGNGNMATMFAVCYASDGIHPLNPGHLDMALGIEATLPPALLKGVVTPSKYQALQSFIPLGLASPSMFTDVNPNHINSTTAFNPGILFQSDQGVYSYINYQSATGLTIGMLTPSLGFSVCTLGALGFSGPPPSGTACHLTAGANGGVNLEGTTFQVTINGIQTSTTSAALIQGNWIMTGTHTAVQSAATATSSTNFASVPFCYNAAVWETIGTGSPGAGKDGPCFIAVPISPTPGADFPSVYLSIQHGISAHFGLDLSLSDLPNKLGNSQFTGFAFGASQVANNFLGTTGTSVPVATGSFTSHHLRMSNATFDEVDSTILDTTVCLTNGTNCQRTWKTGTTASIGGGALTAGTCSTGTAGVTGATVGNPVEVSASDGSLPNPLVVLAASVTATSTVSVQVCAIAAVTPTAKTYNVSTY